MTHHAACPFCNLPPSRILEQDALALMIRDGYPVSEGHTLIIPKRHVGSYFELTSPEMAAIHGLLRMAK